MENYYSFYQSPVGLVKIICSPSTVTAISFSEDPEPPQGGAENNISMQAAHEIREYFEGSRRIFEFPVQQQGTDFQSTIWKLLHNIPYGKTISYATLARQYGDMKAIRAVAAANGKNRLAIVVPCHRVIGTNRSLTGYAGGLWRKQWLLEHEAKYFSGVQQLGF